MLTVHYITPSNLDSCWVRITCRQTDTHTHSSPARQKHSLPMVWHISIYLLFFLLEHVSASSFMSVCNKWDFFKKNPLSFEIIQADWFLFHHLVPSPFPDCSMHAELKLIYCKVSPSQYPLWDSFAGCQVKFDPYLSQPTPPTPLLLWSCCPHWSVSQVAKRKDVTTT